MVSKFQTLWFDRLVGYRATVVPWVVVSLLLVGVFFGFPSEAVCANSDVPGEVAEVQDALYRLEFDRADAACNRMISRSPEDPTGYAFLSTLKWNLLLQAAANLALDDYSTPTPFSKEKTYKPIARESQEFHQVTDKLISVCQEVLQKDPDNVHALYFQGLAYENLSGEQLAVLKNKGDGIRYGRRAVKIHRQVLSLAPEFVDANLSVATEEFACATLPWGIKFFAFILGCRGNKEEALAKLRRVAEQGIYRPLDARVVLALLHSWKGDPNQAVRILGDLAKQYPMNYLIEINRAAIFENSLENRIAARGVYEGLLEKMDVMEKLGLRPGEIHYRIGKTEYGLREYSKALAAFEQAVKSKCSEAETLPLSHYYMALIHEEQGDKQRAIEHYRLALNYAGPEEVLKDELKEARKKTSAR